MPIRPEFREFYGREWRTVVRPAILRRAGYKCEQCQKPNHAHVWVWSGPSGQYWTRVKGDGQLWHYCALGGGTGNFRLIRDQWNQARQIRVVLTIAHLNHTPGDDRPENLMALCQWCHLNYDKVHHRETRATRKDRSRELLALPAAAVSL